MQARLILCVMLSLPVAAWAEDAPAEKHWQKVMSGGSKVGFVEHSRRVVSRNVFRTEVLTLHLGTSATRQTYVVRLETESAADGSLLRLVRESKTPEGHALVEARRGDDGGLIVSVGTGAAKHTQSWANTGALASEELARGWLKAVGSGATPAPLTYRTFDPGRLALVEVRLTRVELAGPPYRARRVLSAANAQATVELALDADGHVIDEVMRLGATTLHLVGSTESEARARGERLNHVTAQMQRSPYRIPRGELRSKIRYGFAHDGAPPRLPEGAGQRSWSDDQTTWIQVCASCPIDPAPLDEAQRTAALAPTPWLNFDDAMSRRARVIAPESLAAARRMQRLTNLVRGHMTAKEIDMLGYGSALEAWRSRRGDCTEYAVLLAAMGRAAGVPTRVVSGLVYSRQFEGQRHVFVPHAWVQAWTGTGWESFDAALGQFDSTHLAFAASDDGNPAQLFAGIHLAHDLKLRSAARLIPREASKD